MFPKKKKPIDEESAKLKMADLCARSEQCEYDINQKLYRMGLPLRSRSNILEFLKKHRFIDDERFAKSYTQDKSRFALWGPYKIRLYLSQKKISSEFITDALDLVEEEKWKEAAEKVAISKVKNIDLIGEGRRENRIKLYRFLITRGFSSDLSKKTVFKMIERQKEK